MPKITILEDDQTQVIGSLSTTDVVYVPGFADTNSNYYILSGNVTPDENLSGTANEDDNGNVIKPNRTNINDVVIAGEYPAYACNTDLKKTWYYYNNEWVEYTDGNQSYYVEPYPENKPVLCNSISEFENNFGKLPYKFTEEQPFGELFIGDAKPLDTNMYNVGDYERSYIYAKELLNLGLPVIYENFTNRISTGGDKLFYLTDLVNKTVDLNTNNTDFTDYFGLVPTYQGKLNRHNIVSRIRNSGNITSYKINIQDSSLKDEFGSNSIDYVHTDETVKKLILSKLDENFMNILPSITVYSGKSGEIASDFIKVIDKVPQESNPQNPQGVYSPIISLGEGAGITIYDGAESGDNFIGKYVWKDDKDYYYYYKDESGPEHIIKFCKIIDYQANSVTIKMLLGNNDIGYDLSTVIPFGTTIVLQSINKIANIQQIRVTGDIGQITTKANLKKVLNFRVNNPEYTSTEFEFVYQSNSWKLNGDVVDDRTFDLTSQSNDFGVVLQPPTSGNFLVGTKYKFKLLQNAVKSNPKITDIYDNLSESFSDVNKLRDKGEYTVKYITSGAYPVYELFGNNIAVSMLNLAESRGDCVALIDHTNSYNRSLTDSSTSVYGNIVGGKGIPNSDNVNTFGAMFTPWATYSCVTAPAKNTEQIMPASFGYLTALAQSIKTNANYIAVAGVNRGLPPTIMSLNTAQNLSNNIADSYQPSDARAINAITNIRPYGLTIWGNRTLASNADGGTTALSFLNVRNLVSDVKKIAYTTAKSLLFEQDSETMWNKFKFNIADTLDRMVAGNGLKAYKIIRSYTTYTGNPLGRGQVAAIIKLFPIYAVEEFEITVVMSDDVDVQ